MSKSKLTDAYLIKTFLLEIKKRSHGAFENNKTVLKGFFSFIKKPIAKITMIDVRDYFEKDLDVQRIQNNTKNSRRYMLISFFDYVKKMYLSENQEYYNPVPSKKIFQFTKREGDIVRRSQKNLKVLTKKQLKQILRFAFDKYDNSQSIKDMRSYILLLLAICTGARISEIRTILLADLHLEEGFFETGFTLGARKSSLSKGEGLLFFFPKALVPILEEYLDLFEYPSKWLFPGYKNLHVSHDFTGKIPPKIIDFVGFKFSWHYFRRTIITERKKMGCPLDVSELLMNHSPSSVEAESYIKLSIPERKELYDKWFPYTEMHYFQNI